MEALHYRAYICEQYDESKFERTWNCETEIIFRQYVNQDKPRGAPEVDENLLWEVFEKPVVNTITQKYPEKYQENLETLEFMQEFTDNVKGILSSVSLLLPWHARIQD